nr:hypothetical protein HK105_002003 [Polyrhizophydium stewartii]
MLDKLRKRISAAVAEYYKAIKYLSAGSLYAWSGYNLPIEAYIYGINGGVDRSIASNVFYLAVAALLGPWLERRGPIFGCYIGAGFFFAGNLISAFGVYSKHIELVFFGYGVIGGIGLGIAYIAPISPLQKWFPEARVDDANMPPPTSPSPTKPVQDVNETIVNVKALKKSSICSSIDHVFHVNLADALLSTEY